MIKVINKIGMIMSKYYRKKLFLDLEASCLTTLNALGAKPLMNLDP